VASRGAAPTARDGAHRGGKKASEIAAAAVPGEPAGGEEEMEMEMEGAAEGEPHTGTLEAGSVEQEYSGAGEEGQTLQEVEGSHDESAAHDEQAYEQRSHEERPAEGDATGEPDADTLHSQSPTAEDPAKVGEDVLAATQAALPGGEKEAEHSFSGTGAEAEAALPEHEAETPPKATEPEARMDDVKPQHPAVSNELESMVNMLQVGPPFPSSTHLDVAGEIPDEE
jgi:hypothetical protein